MQRTLGHHELLVRLASGGAANVFLVRDLSVPPPGRLLALKILLPSLAANEDFLRMFFTEARIASRLRHPAVVAIAGFGQVEGIHCLGMEYVFGVSLAQVLRASARAKKPLTVGVLLRITSTVCAALHFAHELAAEDGSPMGLVHRDVTPQNILIGFNGQPKLTDFGIAKATNRGWETQAGIVKGKFSYMSPEQALGKKVDRRSDIFCSGIVLWEALTGRDLFRGSTPMEVLTAVREQKIEPPSKVVQGLTPIVDPIVMKALRRSPRGRYQSAEEMRLDIEDLIQRAGVTINNETISSEFAAIYGDEIVDRAFALRQAMAGRPDLEHLAKVLGGSMLSPKHLPVIPGGLTDPDPLGLFSEPGKEEPSQLASFDSVMPARIEQQFKEASAPPPRADSDLFEIVEGDEVELADLEPEPMEEEFSDDLVSDRFVQAWDDSTALAVPDDDLLSMISEEDATVGYLPPEFAQRFGSELARALDAEGALDPFDDELTVGMNNPPDIDELRRGGVVGEIVGGSTRRDRQPAFSLRPVPVLPSSASGRPIPRAPSLDMDGATPRPKLEEAALPLPSRPIPAGPPPPPPGTGVVPGRADTPTAKGPVRPSSAPPLVESEETPSSLPGAPVHEDEPPDFQGTEDTLNEEGAGGNGQIEEMVGGQAVGDPLLSPEFLGAAADPAATPRRTLYPRSNLRAPMTKPGVHISPVSLVLMVVGLLAAGIALGLLLALA